MVRKDITAGAREAGEILAEQFLGNQAAREQVDREINAFERALAPTPWTFLKETRERFPR